MDVVAINGKVKWVSIEVAQNGFMVNWDEQSKREGASEYEHMNCVPKKIVFTADQEDEAFDLFVKLKKLEMSLTYKEEKTKARD